ncbi:YheC/YheD family protein [Virgibacillus xinjiangensis]|uniref:YheC/YheD family protein n=1 Tax=Virgibacillus xinjiangensis TaxID=393090 RepID=A0ABV7CU20_9BACI
MIVGFMRNNRKPFKMVRLLAKACAYYDIDLVYFHAKDIDLEKEIIHGKMLINNKWITKEISPPPFVDISPYCFKYEEEFQFLKKNSLLSITENIGSKEQVYNEINKDGAFADLIIPTERGSDFDKFYNFLLRNGTIVIKPAKGVKGKNVFMLSGSGKVYTLSRQQTEDHITKEELHHFFTKEIQDNDYLLQKYIHSRTITGDPFDCRIRLEKGEQGKWKTVVYLIRVGTNQKVISNTSQGGSVSKLIPFLEANFPENKDNIEASIKEVAAKLPYKLEEIYNQDFGALGLDIGIDTDGKLYLFEVETGPGTEFGTGEIALIKPDYYNYILQKINSNKE